MARFHGLGSSTEGKEDSLSSSLSSWLCMSSCHQLLELQAHTDMPSCYVGAVGPNSGLHAYPVTTFHTDPSPQLHHLGLMGIPFSAYTPTCSHGMSFSPCVPCICIIKQSGSSAWSLRHSEVEIATSCKEELNWLYVAYWTIPLFLLNMRLCGALTSRSRREKSNHRALATA